MNLKQDLEKVKNEFKSDEKIFESAFKVERFFKKYKYLLIVILVAVVVFVAYIQISSMMQESKAQKATEFYTKLLNEPNNQALRDGLEKNSPELFLLFRLAQAMKNGNEEELAELGKSKNQLVAALAKYQNATLKKDLVALAEVKEEYFLDLAKIQQAFLLIQNNKVQESHELLQSITEGSPLKEVAKTLLHYRVGEKN